MLFKQMHNGDLLTIGSISQPLLEIDITIALIDEALRDGHYAIALDPENIPSSNREELLFSLDGTVNDVLKFYAAGNQVGWIHLIYSNISFKCEFAIVYGYCEADNGEVEALLQSVGI